MYLVLDGFGSRFLICWVLVGGASGLLVLGGFGGMALCFEVFGFACGVCFRWGLL